MLIYLIKNKINGKLYVGQTKGKLRNRIASYRCSTNRYLHRKRKDKYPIIFAMIKYGFENFSFEILEDNINTQSELDTKEQFYIAKYDSRSKHIGYNIQIGGKSGGHGRHKKLSNDQIKELIDLYQRTVIDQFHTIADIYKMLMDKYSCSRSTILRIFHENNITLRKRIPTFKSRQALAERNRLR